MGTAQERTVIALGRGSCAICIPKAWLRGVGLKKGDKVLVETNGTLRITPLVKAAAPEE
jgi:antitoxin component of MazEF toxin-antitoxin module